jgi:hypothetical protein
MSKQSLDSKVFSLASNLFGFGNTTEKKTVENNIATSVAISLQPENRIMAVYPAISLDAFSITMDNYRKYISAYNFKTIAENELTEKHNVFVRKFLIENTLTDIQR